MGLRGGGDRVVMGVAIGLLAVLAALVGLVVLAVWALAAPAAAQTGMQCSMRDALTRDLTGRWQEYQAGSGLAGGRIIELWVSPDTGTWTLLITTAGGVSCLATAGEGWVALPLPQPGEDM